MYLITLVVKPENLLSPNSGFLSILGPETAVVRLFGASGGLPVFGNGRWWTVLSASFLHGGLIHIYFNLSNLRPLIGQVEELLGLGRTILIYTISSVTGFALTSCVRLLTVLYVPSIVDSPFAALAGANISVGASAALCGLVGAMLAYGQRAGHFQLKRFARNAMIAVMIMGFVLPFVDNWAHFGGFLGGWAAARLLRPLEDESPTYLLGGVICLVLMAASIIVSIVHGLPIYHQWLAQQQ